jgi:hypothetical protein
VGGVVITASTGSERLCYRTSGRSAPAQRTFVTLPFLASDSEARRASGSGTLFRWDRAVALEHPSTSPPLSPVRDYFFSVDSPGTGRSRRPT